MRARRGCVCTLCLEEVVHKGVCMCECVFISAYRQNAKHVMGISIYCLKLLVCILCVCNSTWGYLWV